MRPSSPLRVEYAWRAVAYLSWFMQDRSAVQEASAQALERMEARQDSRPEDERWAQLLQNLARWAGE